MPFAHADPTGRATPPRVVLLSGTDRVDTPGQGPARNSPADAHQSPSRGPNQVLALLGDRCQHVPSYLSTLAGTYPLLPQRLLVVHEFHRTELPDR